MLNSLSRVNLYMNTEPTSPNTDFSYLNDAIAKMEQTIARVEQNKGVPLFRTDYLE